MAILRKPEPTPAAHTEPNAHQLGRLAPNDSDAVAIGQLSDRLYNRDLAPTLREGRHWRAYNVFSMWANDVHSLGNYAFAIGLFALGLGVWQIMLSFMLGGILIGFTLLLSGFMGEKLGVPFPVISRIAFGIEGAHVAALIRGVAAIVWFGIQTFLACRVLRILLIALFPALKGLDANSVIGLSTLGWLTFAGLWIIQVVIVSYGMAMVRHFVAFAGPAVLITMFSLAAWIFFRAGGSIALSTDSPLTGGAMWHQIFAAAALWMVIYATFVLNFCDFTRAAVSQRAIVKGNFFGIFINMLFFAGIVVVMGGGQFAINGHIITNPSDIVRTISSTPLLVIVCLVLVILTMAVNLVANFVAPIYMLVNLFPRSLNFGRAAIISAVIGWVILPWNLYNAPTVIEYFLGGLGALLGPVFGVIMTDYWLIRKRCVDVPALFSDDRAGEYYFRSGVNLRAITALVPASAITIVIALAPQFNAIASFSWFFGSGIAAIIYFVISDRKHVMRDVDGQSIAVPSE